MITFSLLIKGGPLVLTFCVQTLLVCVIRHMSPEGFAGAGDLETAIQLLGQMQGMEIQPDSILFNTILPLTELKARRQCI